MKVIVNRSTVALAITTSAAMATAIACATAIKINQAYYNIKPFFGDTSSFFYVQFTLYFDTIAHSKYEAIWQRFVTDPKNPLGYLHYLLFPPSFLLSMNSHLVFTAIAFLTFSAVLGWTVFQRTGSPLYGSIAPFLIFCSAGLFDPMYQLPSKLSDPPAAFIFGTAVLCLVNSERGRKLGWLAGFGFFAGLTLLSRFTASGYLFFTCAPVLAVYLAIQLKEAGLGSVLRALCAIILPLLVVAGWHFFAHVRDVLYFYGIAGYGLGQGLNASIRTTLIKFFLNFSGTFGLMAAGTLCASYFILFRRQIVGSLDLYVTAWIALAAPLIVVGILRIEDDSPQLAFGLAGYLLFALAPFPLHGLASREKRNVKIFSFIVALTFVATTIYGVSRSFKRYTTYASAQDSQMVDANREMARLAAVREKAQGRGQTIDASFDYYWRHLQPTAYYSLGILLRTTRQFEIRKEKWWLRYHDKTQEETLSFLASDYTARTDIIYVLSEPATPQGRMLEKDDYTIQMAEKLRDWLRASPSWSKLGVVSFPYGTIEVWGNDRRT